MKNDLLLRTLRGEKTERPPVWLMRQAGRILPEYRNLRKKVGGFKELVQTPDLAAEVTIQPVDRLKVDAAIMFSDILVIPEALGFDYHMVEKKGPSFDRTLLTPGAHEELNRDVDIKDSLWYVHETVRKIQQELNGRVPLIGFAGSPWTIFSYMVEGGGSKTFSNARKFLYTQPELAHQWLDKITDTTIAYLNMQIEAGVQAVQLFDSWAGILFQEQYRQFGVKYLDKICQAIHDVPVILFSKGAYFSVADLAQLDCQAIGVDWHMNPAEVRAQTGDKILQGNLDPCCLYADEKTIEEKVFGMVNAFGKDKYIANLGHGVYPDTDYKKVQYFVSLIQSIENK